MDPPSRLGSEGDAKAYFDSVISDYSYNSICLLLIYISNNNNIFCTKKSSSNGVSVSSSPSQSMVSHAGPAVNSAELIKLQLKQDTFIREQLELYAAYLGHNLREGHTLHEKLQESADALQKEIDLWRSEMGEYFADGIG